MRMKNKIRSDPKINGLHRLGDVIKEVYPHLINKKRKKLKI